MKKSSSQNGNVLILIFIAVALFAGLSYAVSDGMRGGGETISKQQAGVAAGDILRSMQSIKEGYTYLMNQGCSIDDIAFDSPASANLDCQVFHPQGAGISYPQNLEQYQVTPIAAPNTAQTGRFFFVGAISHASSTNYSVVNLGTSAQEHMVVLNFAQQEICEATNKQLKYNFSSTPSAEWPIGTTTTEFAGKSSGCHGAASNYQIWFVLLEL